MEYIDRPSFSNVSQNTPTDDSAEHELEQNLHRTMESDADSLSEINGFYRQCILGDLQGILGYKHVVHTIHGFGRHINGDDRCQSIQNLHRSGRNPKPFIAVARHTETNSGRSHIHIVHACSFSNRSCRCRFVGNNSRGAYKCVRRGDVTVEYLRNILHYFDTWPRELDYLHLPGNSRQILYSNENLQICRCVDCSAREIMDEGLAGYEICGDRSARGLHHETYNGLGNRNSSLLEGAPQSRTIHKEEEIYELVKKLCITPINNTVLSIHWLRSPFKFLPRGSPILQTIFNTWSREIKHMTITELNDIYAHTEPFFSCTSTNISDFYYSTDETITRCNTILQYQFPDMDLRINFLQQLLLVITKLNGKKKTLCITGPPSSGKTYFVRFVSSFFISIGQVRNFNRNDSFPLNDCTDKRILLWDEPNYTRENLETIKMLFSGDNTPANVKYENQLIIEKTPLLITTNTDVFPTSDDFNKRMVRFRWSQLPPSEEDHKQLYPLALPKLFELYNLH